MNDNTKICTCDTMNLEAITHLWNYRPRKFRNDAFLFWSRGPDSYRKNDRKRAVVWPWLVLQLSTVLALTQLGIRQSDWRRAGIRSTNLHIVVECRIIVSISVLSLGCCPCAIQWGINTEFSLSAAPNVDYMSLNGLLLLGTIRKESGIYVWRRFY